MARRDPLTITEDIQQTLDERARRRGADRKRRRYPTEDRRAGRVIGPTLSAELVDRLREIGQAEGYIDQDGQGKIASPIIEDLLWYAVDAYDAGELRRTTETRETTRHRLERNDAGEGKSGGERKGPD